MQALIDTAMGSSEPVTLIAIGPPPNLKAALEREPRIAGKLRLAGMYGSLRRGYGGKPTPERRVERAGEPGRGAGAAGSALGGGDQHAARHVRPRPACRVSGTRACATRRTRCCEP